MCVLSIIVPAYDAETVVGRCLDSIYSSGLYECDFEVIVIDDCSTDNTLSVLNGYASGHRNMMVIHQNENHRQGAARNIGIRLAKGKYITFVDSDDIVESGIKDAIEYAVEKNVDIVCCGALYSLPEDPDTFIRRKNFAPFDVIFNGREFCETFFDFLGFDGTTPWGYLFKRSFIQSQYRPFVENKQWEDNDWVAWHFFNASSVVCAEPLMYRYISNPYSTMNRMSFSRVVDHISCGCRRMRLAEGISYSLFSEKVFNDSVCHYYITGEIGFKYWSVFPIRDVLSFYRRLDAQDLIYLKASHVISGSAGFIIRHRILALLCMVITFPILKFGRIVRYGSAGGYKKKH